MRSKGRDEKGSGKPESSQPSPLLPPRREEEEKDPLNWGTGPQAGRSGEVRRGCCSVHRTGAGLESEAVSGSTALGLWGLGHPFCHLDRIAHFSCTNDPRRL